MEYLTPLELSRIQFALNISLHILFPTITISLGWLLLFFKLREKGPHADDYMRAYDFFVKVFALSFALGVVSGITMSFQFGTNWPGFMNKVGNIAGPLLAYEVLTAFFLEAVFLGIMLFGRSKVPSWIHTLATFLVAFGTTMSAFWIIVLNSWMHTPAGYELKDGVVHATDWFAIIFNPSMPYRFIHVLLASGLTTAFLIAGLSAYRLKKGTEKSKTTLKVGVYLAAILIPVQIFMGDMHGLNTLEYQPQKVAAMEGNWETGQAPLILFAIPDSEIRDNKYEIGIPNLASFILTHHWDGEVPGLNDFVSDGGEVLHPPVFKVFWSFRIMVGVGLAMLFVSWLSVYSIKTGKLSNLSYRLIRLMTFSGWVATLSGWYVTEIGRQPWLVTNVLKTKDAVGDISNVDVGLSLIGYFLTYIILLSAYLFTIYRLARKEQL